MNTLARNGKGMKTRKPAANAVSSRLCSSGVSVATN
jgi:hypothetical protein